MYNMSPYSLSRSFRDKPCRAVIYGRASTEHEAQVKALQNQMQWYDDVARFHPQWNVINRYIDQGITGTQVYKRDAFMRMMEDAKQQKFDLIVTREVCRFARNTVDALVCVRQLAAIGIEVYFVNDNICSALICRSCSSTPAERRSRAFPSATATGAEATTPSPLRRTAVCCCARPSRWWITPRATITPPTRRRFRASMTFACEATPRAILISTAILSRR